MNAAKTWTVLELIQWTAGFLKQKGIENARREAEDLLGSVLELDRLKLYLEFETLPSPAELEKFRNLVARRGKREPLQYLLGYQPFLGLKIKTDARALIPRPETERLAELALQRFGPQGPDARFADIGCGSGCLSLALLKGAEGRGIATDISTEALALAKENALALQLDGRLEFVHGDGLEPLERLGFKELDLLVSNPPYIPTGAKAGLQEEVGEDEPASALFAGPEGLDVLRPLLRESSRFLKAGAWLMLECGPGQASLLAQSAEAGFWSRLDIENDQYGVERFLLAQRS